MQRTRFVVASITAVVVACGTTLPERDDDGANTNAADAGDEGSATTESGPPIGIDGGDDQGVPVWVDGGLPDGCTRVIDEPFDQLSAWTLDMQNGGSATHETAQGLDGGGALRAEVTGNSSAAGQATRQIDGSIPKAIRLAFAMRISSFNAGYVEVGCTLQLRGSSDQTFISFQPEIKDSTLEFDSTKKLDDDEIATGAAGLVGAIQPNHWYAVDVRLGGIDTDGGHVTAHVDGVSRYDRNATFPAPPQLIRVKCGIDYAENGAAATVYVDDVVLDLCP